MKVLTDKMIAGAFEFKKNKIWDTLSRDNLIALTFADGTAGYINVFCPLGLKLPWTMGFALYRADELYVYYMMYRGPKGVGEVERQVQRSTMSCVRLEFAPKDEVYDLSADAIRQYREKHGLHASGKNSFFDITRYTPQLMPQFLTDPKDRAHTEEALDFLNWLSSHGGGKRLNIFNDKITCFRAEGKTYKVTEVDLPPIRAYEFPKVPFSNEVLVHRLKGIRKRGVLSCNVVTLSSPVLDEEEDVTCFPWIFLPYLESEDYTIRPSLSRKWDEELVEPLAEELLQMKTVPREIHVINDRTKNLVEDFCRKIGIRLVMGKSGEIIKDMSDDFYFHMDNLEFVDDGDSFEIEDVKENPQFQGIIHTLSMMTDDMIQTMPSFMRRDIEMLADELPDDLRRRLQRLWGRKK